MQLLLFKCMQCQKGYSSLFMPYNVIESDQVSRPPDIVFRMTRVKRLFLRKERPEVNSDEKTPS